MDRIFPMFRPSFLLLVVFVTGLSLPSAVDAIQGSRLTKEELSQLSVDKLREVMVRVRAEYQTAIDDFEQKLEELSAAGDDETKKADARIALDAASAGKIAAAGELRDIASTLRAKGHTGEDLTEVGTLLSENEGYTLESLRPDVALSLATKWWNSSVDWTITRGPGIAFAIVRFLLIIFAFKFLSVFAARVVRRAVAASDFEVSELLHDFAINAIRKTTMVVGVLVAVDSVGIDIAPLLAGLAAAGLVVGLALQKTLSNFASGIMLLLYRPFDVDDSVVAGDVSGKVDSMNLVSTTILTFDNKKIIVPNSSIWENVIINNSANETRRIDMVFGIGYEDDIEHAEAVLLDIVTSHPLVLSDPAPTIRMSNLGESSVDFMVRPWAKTSDQSGVKFDIMREVKMRFDKEGISIPYPQRVVHLIRESEPSA